MDDPRTFEDITADTFERMNVVLATLTEDLMTTRLRVNKLEHKTVDEHRVLAKRVTDLEHQQHNHIAGRTK